LQAAQDQKQAAQFVRQAHKAAKAHRCSNPPSARSKNSKQNKAPENLAQVQGDSTGESMQSYMLASVRLAALSNGTHA
jgi:hypothetical protein